MFLLIGKYVGINLQKRNKSSEIARHYTSNIYSIYMSSTNIYRTTAHVNNTPSICLYTAPAPTATSQQHLHTQHQHYTPTVTVTFPTVTAHQALTAATPTSLAPIVP